MSKSTITVIRRHEFAAGHRLLGHEGKCAHLHGHNYQVSFHVNGEELDALGRVIDFGDIKKLLVSWVEEHWDHAMILWKKDQEALAAMKQLPGQKIYLMDANPTAENMANTLLLDVGPKLLEGKNVTLTRVVLKETEKCTAEASL